MARSAENIMDGPGSGDHGRYRGWLSRIECCGILLLIMCYSHSDVVQINVCGHVLHCNVNITVNSIP